MAFLSISSFPSAALVPRPERSDLRAPDSAPTGETRRILRRSIDRLRRRRPLSPLRQREAVLRVAGQTHGGKTEEVAALQIEAEIARDEATSAWEKLHEVQTITQRTILTQEEMEEVVLKRCWLARYWSLCIQYGIHAEIAEAKYEHWSSFAPCPVEVVLAAGQKAKEENSYSKPYCFLSCTTI
ncbi:hypothetical protein NL676_019987 [Syzygium grande]|nr:hypothetical protein NL676_019987 [Syzygium grande]